MTWRMNQRLTWPWSSTKPGSPTAVSASARQAPRENTAKDILAVCMIGKFAWLVVAVCACSLQAAEVCLGALSSACKATCVLLVECWQPGM
jgi:hypothetical protein